MTRRNPSPSSLPKAPTLTLGPGRQHDEIAGSSIAQHTSRQRTTRDLNAHLRVLMSHVASPAAPDIRTHRPRTQPPTAHKSFVGRKWEVADTFCLCHLRDDMTDAPGVLLSNLVVVGRGIANALMRKSCRSSRYSRYHQTPILELRVDVCVRAGAGMALVHGSEGTSPDHRRSSCLSTQI